MVKRVIALIAALLFMAVAPVWAQAADPDKQAHWGVTIGFVPQWQVPQTFKILFDAKSVNITGSDLELGIVHESTLGSGTSFLYVRKSLKDGSTVNHGIGTLCFSSSCAQLGTLYTSRGATLQGFEVRKFISFGTIKRRVQIGMNLAGGVASVKGQADQVVYSAVFGAFDPRTGIFQVTQSQQTQTVPARNLFLADVPTVPLGNVEAVAGVILAPGLKVKFDGGFDFPGYSKFGVNIVYLFGAR